MSKNERLTAFLVQDVKELIKGINNNEELQEITFPVFSFETLWDFALYWGRHIKDIVVNTETQSKTITDRCKELSRDERQECLNALKFFNGWYMFKLDERPEIAVYVNNKPISVYVNSVWVCGATGNISLSVSSTVYILNDVEISATKALPGQINVVTSKILNQRLKIQNNKNLNERWKQI